MQNERNAKLCTIIQKIAEGIGKFPANTDILGDAYEYLIGQFAAGSGKKAGEFYTPQEISTIGCDSFFVFRYGSGVKILAVEGKYPRFGESSNGWDKAQKSTKGKVPSHFSDQLSRQKLLANAGIVVLEMFHHDGKVDPKHHGAKLAASGSSFVGRQIANKVKSGFISGIAARTRISEVWKTRDAVQAINNQHALTGDVSLPYFIDRLLTCEIGDRFHVGGQDESVTISSDEFPDTPLVVPLPLLNNSRTPDNLYLVPENDDGNAVVSFMTEHGLQSYAYMEIPETELELAG